jgi:hypothetical protein
VYFEIEPRTLAHKAGLKRNAASVGSARHWTLISTYSISNLGIVREVQDRFASKIAVISQREGREVLTKVVAST